MSKVCSTFHRSVKNSKEVVQLLRQVNIPKGYILISLDVVSLFPNIPKMLILDIIRKKWRWFECYTDIPKDLFIRVISFLFESSYFVIEGRFYMQLDGSAMGNPSSPSIANLMMEVIIQEVLSSINYYVPIGIYYVDDSLFCIPREKIDEFVSAFNAFHPKVQFTFELEKNQRLPFLDILVERNDEGEISTNWYNKPSASGRTLNFHSNHPSHQKKNVVKNLIHRMTTISDERYWKYNFEKIKLILKDNNYPSYFVNKMICEWRKKSPTRQDIEVPRAYSKLPNIPVLTINLRRMFRNEKIGNIATYNVKTTNSLFSRVKHKEDKMKIKNLVYQFDCLGCDKIYIGETKQQIRNRIKQHKNSCKHSYVGGDTALSLHCKQNDHIFNYQEFKILTTEKDDKKRKTQEAIYIMRKRDKAINFKSDTDSIGVSYNNIIQQWMEE